MSLHVPIVNVGSWPRQSNGILDIQVGLDRKERVQTAEWFQEGEMKCHLRSGIALIIPTAIDFLGREIKPGSLWTERLKECLYPAEIKRLSRNK